MNQIQTFEELLQLVWLTIQLLILILSTSVGTFAMGLVAPKVNTVKENIGLSFVAGFIAFAVKVRFTETISSEWLFLVCIGLGFFIPFFKNWFKGKKLFKILFRVLHKTSDLTSNIIDEVSSELEKEED